MSDYKNHFPDLRHPLREIELPHESKRYTYKSFCGFTGRKVTTSLAEVDCLLCLRSIKAITARRIDVVKNSAPAQASVELDQAIESAL